MTLARAGSGSPQGIHPIGFPVFPPRQRARAVGPFHERVPPMTSAYDQTHDDQAAKNDWGYALAVYIL